MRYCLRKSWRWQGMTSIQVGSFPTSKLRRYSWTPKRYLKTISQAMIFHHTNWFTELLRTHCNLGCYLGNISYLIYSLFTRILVTDGPIVILKFPSWKSKEITVTVNQSTIPNDWLEVIQPFERATFGHPKHITTRLEKMRILHRPIGRPTLG